MVVDFLAANVAVRLLIYKLNEHALPVLLKTAPNEAWSGTILQNMFYHSLERCAKWGNHCKFTQEKHAGMSVVLKNVLLLRPTANTAVTT